MQMLFVWNLTEIDANEPDKVLTFIVLCLWVYLSIALSWQFSLPVNSNLQIAKRGMEVGGRRQSDNELLKGSMWSVG